MRVVKWIILGVLGLIAAIVVVGVILLSTFDVEDYRDVIQAQAEKATGRELTLAGPMDLSISLTPSITVEQVSFANAPWGTRPEMVTMKRFELQIALIPALSGEIRVQRIVLVKPDILLETNTDGEGNWQIGTGGEQTESAPEAKSAPIIPAVDVVQIEDGVLTYHDGQTGDVTVVKLKSLEASAEDLSSPLTLKAEGSVQNTPFSIDGTFGSLDSVMAGGGGAFPIDLKMQAAGLDLKADGSIADPKAMDGVALSFEVSGDSTAEATKLAGLDVPAIGPLKVSGKVTKSGDMVNVENLSLSAQAGGADITAEGAVSDALGAQNAALEVDVKGDSLKTLSDLAKQDLPDIGPYSVHANVKKQGDDVSVSDLDVSAKGGGATIAAQGAVTDALGAQIADVRISVKGDSLKALGAVAGQDLPDVGPYAVEASVHKEGDTVNVSDIDVSAKGEGTTIKATGSVADALGSQQAALDISLSSENLAKLGSLAGQDLPPIGPLSVSGKVERKGDVITVSGLSAKVAGSDLSGRISANVGGDRPAVSGALTSNTFNLADVAPPGEGGGSAGESSSSPYVFTDDPLPLDGLKSADADITLKVGTFKLNDTMAFQNVNLKLGLQNGNLAVAPLTTKFADGAIAANVRLDGSKATPTLAADLNVAGINYGKFLSQQGISNDVSGTLDVAVDLTGAGNSMRGIASTLNGRTSIVGNQGTISNRLLSIISSGLADIYGPLLGGDKNVRMNCLVSDFDIKNGLANSKALVVDTSTFTVAGGGTVDLKSEKLNMYVDVNTKTASIASLAVPVNVGGTLKSPSFVPDPLATASAAAKAIGSLANISDVGMIGNLLGQNKTAEASEPVSDNPCVQAAVAPQATVTSEGPITGTLQGLLGGEGGAAAAVQNLLGGTGGEGVGGAVQGLLGGEGTGGMTDALQGMLGGSGTGAGLESILGGSIEGSSGTDILGATGSGAGTGGALEGLLGGAAGAGLLGGSLQSILGGTGEGSGAGIGGAVESLTGGGQQTEGGTSGLGGALEGLLGGSQQKAPASGATESPEVSTQSTDTSQPAASATSESAGTEQQGATTETQQEAQPQDQQQQKTPEDMLKEGLGGAVKSLFGN
jgi:uncharacterized protein involved in outer membrane biogenesis